MKVLALSIAAVIVSAAILGVLQYRSLVQLEIRTRTSFQDDLVRAAQAIARTVEDDVRAIGSDALSSFGKQDPVQNVGDLADRFRELRRRWPEIEDAFVFALDDPKVGTSAVFSIGDGAQRFT